MLSKQLRAAAHNRLYARRIDHDPATFRVPPQEPVDKLGIPDRVLNDAPLTQRGPSVKVAIDRFPLEGGAFFRSPPLIRFRRL